MDYYEIHPLANIVAMAGTRERFRMYRMMYKTEGCGAAFMENVKDKEEFFRHRELLATGMGFTTELVNDKLFLFDKGKEFGVYYVEKGK